MRRASVILSTTRNEKGLSLDEISKKTKISVKYLQAIESEDNCQLPNEPYCSMIVRDYADFLGLDGSNTLRLFCRDILARRQNQNRFSRPLSLTPQSAIGFLTVISVLVFFLYLTFEYIKFNRPPNLRVNWPDSISNATLELSGSTDTEATIRVNDKLVIVDDNGKFFYKLSLATTNTQVIVQAQSRSGQTKVEQRIY